MNQRTLGRVFVLSAAVCLLPGMASAAGNNVRIAKCKDAQGHWHYGDSASIACGNNKITVINDEGMRVKEIDGPLTDAQRRAKEQEQAKQDDEQHQVEERKRKDRLLLATYGSEADILHERDRRLNDLGAQIQASQETLSTLRATLARMEAQGKGGVVPNLEAIRAQVQRHERALTGLRKEQETIKSQYDADLQRFRQLKSNPFPGRVIPTAAPTAAPAP